MKYLLQVSNHAEAGSRIPSQAASESWQNIYHGEVESATEARRITDEASKWYRHARIFRGAEVGKLFYAVLRMR